MEQQVCNYCGDVIEDNPVVRGSRVYCTEACAFEATRSKDCSGRTDSVSAPPIVDFPTPAEEKNAE
jgi:hypothetical protein